MARSRFSWELVVAVVSSGALHAVWLAREAKASYAQEATPAEVFFEPESLPLPPPPPPEPEVQPAKAEPAALAPKPAAKAMAKAEAAPPPAAQAGKTLTAPDSDNSSAVADFTMVQGNFGTYAGGTTSALGTSTSAVRGPASDAPVTAAPSRTGSGQRPAAPTGPDRSRAAIPEAADWNCSRLFPTDPEAGDQAAVVIAVTVLASGMPKSVVVLRDPGHGFGAAAKACAMGQRFKPALDREGNSVLATTPPITVRFRR